MRNFLILLTSLVILASCGKDTEPLHTISSISPTGGTFSTIVTITGSGFSDVPGENIVTFNGKQAVVNSSTATQLLVVVPEAAGTGTVNVSINGGAVVGPIFTFQYLLTVSTLAGTLNDSEVMDGVGANAKFYGPYGLELDASGNIIVADYLAVRKVTPAGVVTTIAGSNDIGDEDGIGAGAKFNYLRDVAIAPDGSYYVSCDELDKIKKVTPAGVVSTYIGFIGEGHEDGPAATAKLNAPGGMMFDNQGNLFVAEFSNYNIRKITPGGVVSTLAGDFNTEGKLDGVGTNATFSDPVSLIVDDNNNIYTGGAGMGNMVRKTTPAGVVTTISGEGSLGYLEGSASTALFNRVYGICFGHTGDLVVCDYSNDRIRMIDKDGNTSLMSGSFAGFQEGSAASARYDRPWGIVYDSERSCYYVADRGNHLIRKILVQ